MAANPVQIIGSYISPYVRQVLVVLNLKEIAYQIDPIIPFIGDDVADRARARWLEEFAATRMGEVFICWPKLAAHIGRVLDLPAFATLRPFEDLSCRTPLGQHREALRAAGAMIMSDTYGTAKSRRGILKI